MKSRKFIKSMYEYLNENINIGDNTNYGKVLDKTNTQYFFKNNNFPKGSWIHKSLVNKINKSIINEPLKNKGYISPNYVISAFDNPISNDKIEKYSDDMRLNMMSHDFPPIKGYPIIIDDSYIERYGYFLNGEKITKQDLGKYAWIVTDGHHRVISALNAGLTELKTSIDYSYVDDEDL